MASHYAHPVRVDYIDSVVVMDCGCCTLPVTRWLDQDEEECHPEAATEVTAGPCADGNFYRMILGPSAEPN